MLIESVALGLWRNTTSFQFGSDHKSLIMISYASERNPNAEAAVPSVPAATGAKLKPLLKSIDEIDGRADHDKNCANLNISKPAAAGAGSADLISIPSNSPNADGGLTGAVLGDAGTAAAGWGAGSNRGNKTHVAESIKWCRVRYLPQV
jgi:hypothetical protein